MRPASVLGLLVAISVAGGGCDPFELLGDHGEPQTETKPRAPSKPEGPAPAPAAHDADALELGLRPAGDGYDYADPGGHFTATIAADGTISFQDQKTTGDVIGEQGLRIGGASDWAKRRRGQANSPAKLDLVKRTSKLRADMALSFHEEQDALHLEQLGKDLGEIWGKSDVPAKERRKLLFARWDECEDGAGALAAPDGTPPSPVDALRAQAGSAARRAIEAFVRETLPAGGADAYSEQELAELNADRVSVEAFAPYSARP